MTSETGVSCEGGGVVKRRFTHKPMLFRAACAYIAEHHRHHKPPTGHLFSLGLYEGGKLIGVGVVGRPNARKSHDGVTAEITRLCVDGTEHAASSLIARCRRAANVLGYSRVLTYTLPEEGGASLRAAGFLFDGMTDGGSWSRADREREDHAPICPKSRWADAA